VSTKCGGASSLVSCAVKGFDREGDLLKRSAPGKDTGAGGGASSLVGCGVMGFDREGDVFKRSAPGKDTGAEMSDDPWALLVVGAEGGLDDGV